jgi:hypothetical protein
MTWLPWRHGPEVCRIMTADKGPGRTLKTKGWRPETGVRPPPRQTSGRGGQNQSASKLEHDHA